MTALPGVSLIVVNWNGRAYLEGCLTSLLALDYPDFSVVVVDNASTDGSADVVRYAFPQVGLICSPVNLGYGAGANLALRTCSADFAVVLNTDIIVPPDWLAHLMAPLREDPTIGIAGCKMYYPDGRKIQHAGGYITPPQAWPGHYGLGEEDWGQVDALRDVDYVIGAALALRRRTWTQIGLFDKGYFLYYEDVDLCLRAWRAGERVVYVSDAWLTHLESATTVKDSPAYLERFSIGRWRFILKHYDPAQILNESIPAERVWLTQCSPAERQAAATAYRATLEVLSEIWLARARDGRDHVKSVSETEQALLADQLRALLAFCQQAPESPPEVQHEMNTETPDLNPSLEQLRMKQRIHEQPFVSRAPVIGPLIARLRAAWNGISTQWYVRPLIQQQNELNELLVHQLTEQAICLHDRVRHGDELSARIAELDARLAGRIDFQTVRSHDHDAWLVSQDREASEIVHDLAELRLQLGQMNRLLQGLSQRVDRLAAPPSKEPMA